MRRFQIVGTTDSGYEFDAVYTEKDILHSDWAKRWLFSMTDAGRFSQISDENCLREWIIAHWAQELLEDGTLVVPQAIKDYEDCYT